MNADKPSGRVLEGLKKVLTPEQKARKNELARLARSKKKEAKLNDGVPEAAENEYEDDSSDNEPLDEPVVEDPETIRKREIADKRRASLALARSKIKPKSQITKEKNDEIERMKEENQRLKEEADKAKAVKPKIIKKYVKEKPKRQEREQTPQRKREPDSINYLAEQSYAEKLQMKLRENMLNRVMYDTFM
jgi:hypothetical protein